MRYFLFVAWLTLGLLTHGDRIKPIKAAQNPQNKAQIRQLRQKLQEAMPPENQPAARDSLAKQQAEAAIALFKLGRAGYGLRPSSCASRGCHPAWPPRKAS